MKSKTRKILVVEDDENSLCLLETSLGKSGYEVVLARNGVEALEKLRKNNIDMIVSDILMPVMDGFQFCRECKKDNKLQRIPFVFYTATYADAKDEEFALGLGAEKFIVKPCEINELLMVFEAVIEGHREAAPVASKMSINDEETYLVKYNKRLIEKLENKVLDLKKEMERRKQVEDVLQASEERLRSLSRATFEGIAFHREGVLFDFNEQFADIVGYELDELVGIDGLTLVHPEDRELARSRIAAGNEDPYEIRFLCKDGSIKLVEAHAQMMMINGEKLRVTAIRDITERKKTEKLLLEQKKALEQKNIALSEILGQIEIEKKQIKDNVIANAENLLLPIVQKLRLKGESRKYVQLLRKNIQELTSSFGARLTEKRANLTTREIEICNMIKNGLTNKEIARLLNISLGTTEKHRNNIRTKLHIVNKDINLSSFLNTL